MNDSTHHNDATRLSDNEMNLEEHPAWDKPVICRVEVDLPGWLAKLTGQPHWEVFSENEEENCISFAMRASEKPARLAAAPLPSANRRKAMQAEVTLYHNGYAVVDVDGKSLFDGALTAGSNDCARLTYYDMSGEPIALN